MDRIDKKLEEIGFIKQDDVGWRVNYIRKKYDFDIKLGKRESDYCEVVEIAASFDSFAKMKCLFSAHLLGESCSWGHHHCSVPLNDEEIRLFNKKMRKMKLFWRIKRAFLTLKRRLTEDE